MKPVIGITSDFSPSGRKGSISKKEDTFFLRARYVRAVEDMGGVPVILPPAGTSSHPGRMLGDLDGLVVTGSGDDLDPRLYGERKRAGFPVMDPLRARFELSIIRGAVKRNLPLLGICGGLQAMNVALGGSLIQDIKNQVPKALLHKPKNRANPPSHDVTIKSQTKLQRILKRKRLRVNSSHHQAPARIAPGLVVNAVSPDGVIEGLEHMKCRFIIGIQWHPELLYMKDAASRSLIGSFIRASSR